MLKYCLPIALLAAAPAAALAQTAPPAAPSGPQAALQQAAQAFGMCVMSGVRGLAATVTPEAGAVTVNAGCATQRTQVQQAAEAMIATLPADQRPAAQEQLRTQLSGVETQIAGAIRQSRAAPAATPTP